MILGNKNGSMKNMDAEKEFGRQLKKNWCGTGHAPGGGKRLHSAGGRKEGHPEL